MKNFAIILGVLVLIAGIIGPVFYNPLEIDSAPASHPGIPVTSDVAETVEKSMQPVADKKIMGPVTAEAPSEKIATVQQELCSAKPTSFGQIDNEWADINAYERKRGKFKNVDTISYETYDNETLREIGYESHDLRALSVLHWRMIEDRNYDQAVDVLRKSASLGSTGALLHLARIEQMKLRHHNNPELRQHLHPDLVFTIGDEDNESRAHTILAIYELADELGDVSAAVEGYKFITTYPEELNTDGVRSALAELKAELAIDPDLYRMLSKEEKPLGVKRLQYRRATAYQVNEQEGWGAKQFKNHLGCIS